jgi:hypothetical protein
LPLLYNHDPSTGKDIWENLALSSIGGLTSSTVLILSALPALYWIMTRFGWALARQWTRIHRRPLPQISPPPPPLPPLPATDVSG